MVHLESCELERALCLIFADRDRQVLVPHSPLATSAPCDPNSGGDTIAALVSPVDSVGEGATGMSMSRVFITAEHAKRLSLCWPIGTHVDDSCKPREHCSTSMEEQQLGIQSNSGSDRSMLTAKALNRAFSELVLERLSDSDSLLK